MAVIESKYVDVGFFNPSPTKLPGQYGFGVGAGTLSDTANGSSNTDISGIYASTNAVSVVWFNGGASSTAGVQFSTDGTHSNSGWDTMDVGGVTYTRSSASFTSSNTWFWATTTNPFGTTVGADILVEWDDGVSATPPDIDVTETSAREINPGATSYTMSFNNATNGDQYQLRHYDAGAQTGTIVNSTPATAASGAFSIALASADLPASGTADTKWYSLYARRPTANGGDNQYDYCSGTTLVNTLNLTRRPSTPTLAISDDDAESANVGIIYTVTDNNSGFNPDRVYGVQYKNSAVVVDSFNVAYTGDGTYSGQFTQPRNTGTDNYYYRLYVQKSGTGSTPEAELTGTSFSDYEPSNGGDYQPGYIAPDTAVSPVSTTITSVATSASIVINNVTSGEEYQLRNLTGQTQYQSGVASGTSVTISQTGGLPTAGNTVTYSVYARRPTSIGGDNAYDATGDTYTIERSLGDVATPTGFTVTDVVANGGTYTSSTSTTNNLAADALADHTLEFRVDSGTWSATSSYTHNYGVQRVYEARYVRTADSAVSVTPASITRRVADPEITVTPVTSITADNTTDPLKIADIGGATALTQYRTRATGNINGSSVTNLFIAAPLAAGANPDINAANPGELPAAGTSATYTVNARVRTADNGDNFHRQLRTGIANRSWLLTRQAAPTYSVSAPTSINEGASGTVNVTTTNVANSTVLYWDVDLDTDYATSQGTVTINSNAGSFTLSPSADSSTEGAETDTVRLYTDASRTVEVANDSFTINDTSTGGGGSGGGGDGNDTYGINVYGPDGSTIVFSSNLRSTNALVLASPTIAGGASVSYTGIAGATDSSQIAVNINDVADGDTFASDSYTITRSTASGGTIQITNDLTSSRTPSISIYRIA